MSSEDESDEEVIIFHSTPPELQEAAEAGQLELLPKKSKQLYINQYNSFLSWLKLKKTDKISENTLLAYFSELKTKYKPPSMWSKFSMLKATIVTYKNINISNFSKLIAFLKQNSAGYETKKSKVFSEDEVQKFIMDAPDERYLVIKITLIMGLYGGCRSQELISLTTDDVIIHEDVLEVILRNTKNKTTRSFYVKGAHSELIKKYMNMRPFSIENSRFFIKYVDGKCFSQPIGKNTMASYPGIIARYLNLSEPGKYTGHSFRRTGTTIFANQGANMLEVKKYGGWKSTSVAESYVDDSAFRKRRTTDVVASAVSGHSSSKQRRLDACPSTSNDSIDITTGNKTVTCSSNSNNSAMDIDKHQSFVFNNCSVNFSNVKFK